MKEKTHNITRHFAPHPSYLASKIRAKESEGKIHKIQTQEDRLTERERQTLRQRDMWRRDQKERIIKERDKRIAA